MDKCFQKYRALNTVTAFIQCNVTELFGYLSRIRTVFEHHTTIKKELQGCDSDAPYAKMQSSLKNLRKKMPPEKKLSAQQVARV